MFYDEREEDLPYTCGNCAFHDIWSDECECSASDHFGEELRDKTEACYWWGPMTVTVKAEAIT